MRLEIVRITEKSEEYVINWTIVPGSLYMVVINGCWAIYDVDTDAAYYQIDPNVHGSVLQSESKVLIDDSAYGIIVVDDTVYLHGEGQVADVDLPVRNAGDTVLHFNTDRNRHIHIVFPTCIVELAVHK